MHRILLGFPALALLALNAPAAAQDRAVVATDTGSVRGSVDGGIMSWKGIPFAAPPVGNLRWRAPQPAAHWTGVREATEFAHDCMQLPFPSDAAPLGTEPAEDCLYLNVWKPAAVQGKLPVLVWIYGGGFVNGGSSPPTYSGAPLAANGLMVVSFNYRLGRFGTFANPQLTREAGNGPNGNYGYMDQLAALKWVQRNIAAFGGDPDNVTIVGESAGGMSVHTLLTSPLAKGLLDRAVIMSGGDGGGMGSRTLAEVIDASIAFAKSKGIMPDDPRALAKLRSLPSAAIVDGLNLASLMRGAGAPAPFVDGRLAVDARAAYRSGNFAKVPLMIGATNADIGGPTGAMVAGAHRIAGEVAAKGLPVWQYRFSYVASSIDAPGAQHATDIPFFFNTADIKYGAKATARDRAIAGIMSDYLANFAKTGSPNGTGLEMWPRYDAATDLIMDFAASGQPMPLKDPLGPQLNAPAAN